MTRSFSDYEREDIRRRLSAIGVSVPIYLLFVSVILGFAIGITILLSQLFGAKQTSEIKKLLATMSIFC